MKNLLTFLSISIVLIFTGCQQTEESNQQDSLTKENEKIVREYIDAYNDRDIAALENICQIRFQ